MRYSGRRLPPNRMSDNADKILLSFIARDVLGLSLIRLPAALARRSAQGRSIVLAAADEAGKRYSLSIFVSRPHAGTSQVSVTVVSLDEGAGKPSRLQHLGFTRTHDTLEVGEMYRCEIKEIKPSYTLPESLRDPDLGYPAAPYRRPPQPVFSGLTPEMKKNWHLKREEVHWGSSLLWKDSDPFDLVLAPDGRHAKQPIGATGRARAQTDYRITMTHAPTGVQVHGRYTGHYARKEKSQMEIILLNQLFQLLEKRVAKILAIPGRG